MVYTEKNTILTAKRHNNKKRKYLLVNPLQAKHIPVSPQKSLAMMTCLGRKIAAKYPCAKLVIGFAETATAIGAAVAAELAGCIYIHTTREEYTNLSDWIYFNEEHSHAVEQKLYCGNLAEHIEKTSAIVFVDDEFSTGRTLINFVNQLKAKFPEIKNKRLVAASIINRLSPENEAKLSEVGIESECLVKLGAEFGDEVLSKMVEQYQIKPPKPIETVSCLSDSRLISTVKPLPDPRLGVNILSYRESCAGEFNYIIGRLAPMLTPSVNLLVLGTEECMYPALLLGYEIEKQGLVKAVSCHASTRSPIGICSDPSYPIKSGFKLRSFYNKERETYIYNLSVYDLAIVVTDTSRDVPEARADIAKALALSGCSSVVIVEGGFYV